jgi:hypothetical protein
VDFGITRVMRVFIHIIMCISDYRRDFGFDDWIY